MRKFVTRSRMIVFTFFLLFALSGKFSALHISLLWDNTFNYNIGFVVLDKKAGKAISIDHFDLIRVIGRGSYAKVLMVELKETKRLYAMKVIKKELVTDDEVRKENNIISWSVENMYISDLLWDLNILSFLLGYWLGSNWKACFWNGIKPSISGWTSLMLPNAISIVFCYWIRTWWWFDVSHAGKNVLHSLWIPPYVPLFIKICF